MRLFLKKNLFQKLQVFFQKKFLRFLSLRYGADFRRSRLVYFWPERSTFLFICSTTTTWTTDVQNKYTRNVRNSSKTKNRRPEPRKRTEDPPFGCLDFFLSFFSDLWDFFWKFMDCISVPPSILQQKFQKAQRVFPFTILKTLLFLALDIAPTLAVPGLLCLSFPCFLSLCNSLSLSLSLSLFAIVGGLPFENNNSYKTGRIEQ